MYSTLLLTHRIFVTLFLLHYVVKFVLLLAGSDETLGKYTKATRVIEMILSFGFLVTGAWMLFAGAVFGNLLIIKLICVFASIPLAIIGFKRKNKILALLSILLIFIAYGLAEMNKKTKTEIKVDTSSITNPIEAGKIIYSGSCASCHGADGKLGNSGAKDLSVTQLSAEAQKEIIRSGKNAMPGYSNLTDEQLDDVVQYLATLKQ